MPITRILWDDLVEGRLNKKPYDDGHLILSCLKDIDGRLSDLEEQHSEIMENLNPQAPEKQESNNSSSKKDCYNRGCDYEFHNHCTLTDDTYNKCSKRSQ